MRSAVMWFVILTGVCLVGPYLLGVAPKARRHWFYLALTIGFLAWVLPLMVLLRSR